MNPDGEDQRPLLQRTGREGDLRWSPDGERLAFSSAPADQPDRQELLVVDRDGGEPEELGPGFGAAWPPDGEGLAYSRPPTADGTGDVDIFLITLDDGEPRPLSQSITYDRWPTWSPDGGRLAYSALVDEGTAFICVVQLEPEDRDCLDLGDLLPTAPAWSPQ